MRLKNKPELEKHPHKNDLSFLKGVKDFLSKTNNKSLREVKKPWGFEKPIFPHNEYDIWELFITKKSATSLHIHKNKDVLLVVLEGFLTLITTETRELLRPGDFRLIKKGAAHQLANETIQIVRALEVESEPDRNDIVRIQDNYGRAGEPYLWDIDVTNDSEFFLTPIHNESAGLDDNRSLPKIITQQKDNNGNTSPIYSLFLKGITDFKLNRIENSEVFFKNIFIIDGEMDVRENDITINLQKGDHITLAEVHDIIFIKDSTLLLVWA